MRRGKMKKQKPWTGQPDGISRCGFYLIIEGERHGPFLDNTRSQFDGIKRSKGVSFEPVCLKAGWIAPNAGTPRRVKDVNPSLFATNNMGD
jgi:hypothetical protein